MEVIILLIALTVAAFSWVVVSFVNLWDDGFSISIFVFLFLFVISVITSVHKDISVEYKRVNTKQMDTPTCLVVSDSLGIRKITDYSQIKMIDTNTIWYREHTKNIFGQDDIESLLADFEI